MVISFTKASLADLQTIAGLAERIWRVHYPAIITHAQIDYMLDMMYAPKQIEVQMSAGQNYTLVMADGEAIGYYAVSETKHARYFLHKFYIDTALHGRGIGEQALHHMLEEDCKGYEEISLQVNRRNVKAINFYFKNGFKIDRAEDFDIGNGYSMDDFVMIRVPKW